MARGPDLLVMSGNAHPELAQAIANELGIGLVGAEVGHFPDGETEIRNMDHVRGHDVFLIQPGTPPANQSVMEALIMMDALRRASAGRITIVAPFYPYARSDRKERSRVPIAAKLVTDLFTTAGADRFISLALHSDQIQGFTNKPFDHLYAGKAMTDAIRSELDHPVVVAPDVGANKMAINWAGRLGSQWAMISKERQDARTTEIMAIVGESVAGRHALVVDDMISTGGSLLKTADELMERGALSVTAAAVHGVLCDGAVDRINKSSSLSRVYVTDSLPEVDYSEKISRVTIAPLLARAIFNIHNGESVSGLF